MKPRRRLTDDDRRKSILEAIADGRTRRRTSFINGWCYGSLFADQSCPLDHTPDSDWEIGFVDGWHQASKDHYEKQCAVTAARAA